MMGGEKVTCLQSEGSESLGDGLSEIVAEYAFFQSYVSSVFSDRLDFTDRPSNFATVSGYGATSRPRTLCKFGDTHI